MLLILMRHAETKNNSKSRKDFDRSLTKEGVIQAKKLGKFLTSSNILIHHAFVSSSQRTRQTAKYALQTLNNITFDNLLYLPTCKELLVFINKLELDGNILILGHNDGISSLASYLMGQNINLNTANAVILEFDCDIPREISGDTGKLVDFFSPT